MKRILRMLAVNYLCLWLVAQGLKSVNYQGDWQILFLAAATLAAINLGIKPIINLLLLPLTILTLGAFRWVINILGLYLVALVVPGFSIQPFEFPGLSYQGLVIPPFSASLLYSYIITSLIISLTTTLVYWLIKK